MHILLTPNDSVDPASVEMAHLIEWDGQPRTEFLLKREDIVAPLSFVGDEAIEAWVNWQLYVRRAEEERRGGDK